MYSRQAQEGSLGSLHAQTSERPQRHAQAGHLLAGLRLEHVGGARTDKTPALTPALVAVLT